MNGMNANRKIPDVCSLIIKLSIVVLVLADMIFKNLPYWCGELCMVVCVLAAVVMMVYENRFMGKKGRELWTSNRLAALIALVAIVLIELMQFLSEST